MTDNPSLTDAEVKRILLACLAGQSEFARLAPCLEALALALAGQTLHIAFKYSRYAPFFYQNCQRAFEALARRAFGENLALVYERSAESSAFSPPFASEAPAPDPFEDFIESEANAPALAAARKLCQSEASGFRLVIFSGASGSGKTHILQAIAKGVSQANGNKAARFSRAAAFDASACPCQFWKSGRALLIDDLQELSEEPERQKLVTAFIDEGRRSDCGAKIAFGFCGSRLAIFSARLNRRLEQGIRVELFPANLAARIAYAERACQKMGLELRKAQILALARHAGGISSLDGLLQKFKFYASLPEHSLSPEELEKMAMPDNADSGWQRILLQVSEKLGARPPEILGGGRRHDLVLARQIAMYLCRLRLGLSYPELGRLFGGRDHSTVIHGIKKIQQLRQTDKVMRKLLAQLEQESE